MNPLNYMRLHDYSSRNSRQHWINASNGKIRYVCRIYVRGRTWKQCRIWLSGRMLSDQIYYYEGNVDIAGDSAFNEYISAEDDGYTLFLRLSNMGFSSSQQQETRVGKEIAAEYLWKRLTQSLKI